MKTITSNAMTPEIQGFLVELLHDAGQTDLGTDLENILVEDLYSRLVDRLALSAMEHLSAENQDELEKIAQQKDSGAKMETFLKKNIPNYDKVFGEVLADFREVYIQATK